MPKSSENDTPKVCNYPQPARRTTPIRDVDEAEQAFSTAGIDLHLERIADRSAFSIDFDLYPFGAAELMCTNWGTDNWMKAQLADRIAVILNPSGAAPSVFTTSGEALVASTQTAPILLPERKIEVYRPTRSPLLVLSADIRDLERLFRDVTGHAGGRLEFESALNRDSPEGRRFQRLINFALGELSTDPSALDNPIFRRQFDDLILGALVSLPGRHHRLIDRSSSGLASVLVRHAEEFMEANAERPITMSDVAAQCNCSRTKLFQAFRRERKWTPLQFLMRRRLERARRRLMAPTDGLNVTRVSLDCGYANLSRFAQVYKKLYGEAPSMTLHRSR